MARFLNVATFIVQKSFRWGAAYSTKDQYSCGKRPHSFGGELDLNMICIDVVTVEYSTTDQSSCGRRARSSGFELDQKVVVGIGLNLDLATPQSDHNMMTAVCDCCSEPLKKCYAARGPPS